MKHLFILARPENSLRFSPSVDMGFLVVQVVKNLSLADPGLIPDFERSLEKWEEGLPVFC